MRIIRSSSKHAIGLFAGLTILATAPAAFAASTWSDLSNNATQCATDTSGTAGNSVNCGTGVGVPAVKLTADAFSTTAGSTFAAASIYNTGAPGAGLGVLAAGEIPADSAVDNAGSIDAIRLKFTNAAGTQDANFTVSSITIATGGPVADFTLLAWKGPAGTPGEMLGTTATNMATPSSVFNAGWVNVGTFSSAGTVNVGGVPFYSSYWLVAAYSTGFSPVGTAGDDVFTVSAIAGGLDPNAQFKPAQVPEPGSLALFGVALAGMAAVRRRKSIRP